MDQVGRLTDREMFAARPWRAADRSQIIVAVVERQGSAAAPGAWHVVLATLAGATLYSKRLVQQRTPGSFTEAELQTLYDEARGISTEGAHQAEVP
jgi:hypothetical protein